MACHPTPPPSLISLPTSCNTTILPHPQVFILNYVEDYLLLVKRLLCGRTGKFLLSLFVMAKRDEILLVLF